MRSRYGSGGFLQDTPGVRNVLLLLGGSYLIMALIHRGEVGSQLYEALILYPPYVVQKFQIWRLLTYGILHDLSSPFHLLFNAMLLYFIGPTLESRWGERRFYWFVGFSVLMGGIFVCLAFLLGLTSAPVIGFSAATLAFVVAWGLLYAENQIHLFGIIPVTGRQLLYITVGMECLYAVSSSGISSSAHFGGMAMGAILSLGLWRKETLRYYYQRAKWKLHR